MNLFIIHHKQKIVNIGGFSVQHKGPAFSRQFVFSLSCCLSEKMAKTWGEWGEGRVPLSKKSWTRLCVLSINKRLPGIKIVFQDIVVLKYELLSFTSSSLTIKNNWSFQTN